MGTLTRHLSKRLAANVAIVLGGLVALVQTLDLMKNEQGVIARHGSAWSALALYIFLRLPEIVAVVFLFAVLLGALLLFSQLVLSNEALAIRASGVSPWRFLLAFVPAAVSLGALGFLVEAYTAPWASRSLARWDLAQDRQKNIADDAEWVRDGASLVRIGRVSGDHRLLGDVSVFRLDNNGLLAEEMDAEGARFERGQWRLLRVRIFHPSSGTYATVDQMKWSVRLQPRHLVSLTLAPQSMAFGALAEHVFSHLQAAEPARLFVLEMFRRIRFPLLVPLMILLAAPVLMEHEHVGRLARALGFGAAIGFGYFLIDGVALSLGAAGWLPAPGAALATPVIFAALGTAMLLRTMAWAVGPQVTTTGSRGRTDA